jgi:hypothetical protein
MTNEEEKVVNNEVKKPKVVVIVGNGFDLDLGYSTSYNDFVESKWFKALLDEDNIPPELILEDKYADKMQIYPNGLAKYIKEQKEHNNWVDLEECMMQYALLTKNKLNDKDLLREVKALKYFLYQYVGGLKRVFEKYALDRQYKVAYRLITELIQHEVNIEIWNFNYTYYCQLVLEYNSCKSDFISNKLHYIHSYLYEADQDKLALVLGCSYSNELNEVCSSLIKSNMIADYQAKKKLLNKHLSEAENIVFIGHSLGSTDQHYFENILESSNLQAITIITKSEESLNSVCRNLGKITNGDFGRKQQKGTFAVMSFTSNGYYEYPYGIEVVNEDKKQEYDKLLNKITTGKYS